MATEAQLWKVAGKPDLGKHKKAFESPQAFLDKAFRYFEWCDEHSQYREEQAKKIPDSIMVDGHIIPGDPLIQIPVKRPYTEAGLCIFCGVNTRWMSTFEQKHRNQGCKVDGSEDETNLWLEALGHVRDIIKNQQYEGAAAGFFKEGIVARMIGLADKQEVNTTITEVKEYFEIGGKKFQL